MPRWQGDGPVAEVDHAEQVTPVEGEDVRLAGQPPQRDAGRGRARAAQPQRGPVQLQCRTGGAVLGRHGQSGPPPGLRQPGLGPVPGEAVRRGRTGPGQGDPAAVAARVGAAGAEVDRVAEPFRRNVLDLRQAQLLALVEADRPGQRQHEQGGGPGAAGAQGEVGGDAAGPGGEVEGGVGPAVPGDGTGHIVIAQYPGRGGVDGRVGVEGGLDPAAQRPGRPRTAQEVEVEGPVQDAGTQIAGEPVGLVGQPDLAGQDPGVGVGVGDGAPGAVDAEEFVAVDVGMRPAAFGRGVRGVRFGQVGILGQGDGGVDAHPGGTPVEPEAEHGLVLRSHPGVTPVEIGLFGREQVEVPLALSAVGQGGAGPRGAAEFGVPVVRRTLAAGPPAGAEVEQGALGAPRGRGERRAEPRVGPGDVVGHEVDEGAQTQLAGRADQPLGLVQGAEVGVDAAVVRHVVAAVGHRGGIPGGEPQSVHPQPGQIRQPVQDTGEIAGAVAVPVGETARVDLVDDGVAPPVGPGRGGVRHRHGRHDRRPGSGSAEYGVPARSTAHRPGSTRSAAE
ncbi:hypothetical protein GCM10010232_16490 [Streptomyces amakusaensis]